MLLLAEGCDDDDGCGEVQVKTPPPPADMVDMLRCALLLSWSFFTWLSSVQFPTCVDLGMEYPV